MKSRRDGLERGGFKRLMVASAVLALFGAGQPVLAQSFSQSASNNSTFPNNYLPFVGTPTSLNFGDDIVYIGNNGLGTFSALAGAVLNAGALSIANGGTGIGTVNFSGTNLGTSSPTRVELGGTSNRLEVGNWGVGTLTVQAGAVLDATVNAAACTAVGASCYSFIGNAAGSTGTLTITGTGSKVSTLRSFTVGQTAVQTLAVDGFEFGTPGGTTNAVVNVLAGGTLNTERASIGVYTAPPGGTEKANGTVLVSGAGSTWTATYNSVDNQVASITVGAGSGSTGSLTVSAGGKVLVDGRGGPGPNDFVNIGVNGGKGTVEVTGAGSAFDMLGVNTVLQVGRSGVTQDGLGSSFSVLAGATASALYFNVGRDGATGTVVIDGAGSKLSQVGVGTNQSPGSNGPGFANVGRNGGTGVMTVSGGAEWLISDGGFDGRTAQGSPGFILGSGANSNGSLTITGAGSKVEIISSTLNPAVGERDNYNPFVSVGYDNAGSTSGALTVSNGGRLLLNGNALSTAANPNGNSLNIGGRFDTSGTGTATVTGANSQIVLSGIDAAIQVGRNAGSQGAFNVLAGGAASSVFLIAGRDQGQGTVVIDGGGSKLTLSGQGIYTSGGAGPALGLIGWGGNGTTTVSNGGVLQISDGYDTSATPGRGPGLLVGFTAGSNGGTGTLEIKSGSTVDIFSTSISPAPGAGDSANAFASIGIGTGSTGTVNISDGGKLLITGNAVSTPDFSRGTNLNIGGNSDTVFGGTGTVTVSGPGSELRVTGSDPFIAVGRNGTGTLALSNQALVEARNINVGRGKVDDAQFGDGTLTMDNSTLLLSGQQTGNNPSGAALSIGNRGGTGRTTITNGSVVTITNLGSLGASLNVGGTTPNPLGNGELTLSGGSKITVVAAPGSASMSVGRDGTGKATLIGAGTQIDIGDGTLHVGRLSTGDGTINVEGGAKLLTGTANIGGSSDALGGPVGGIGEVLVTGLGSELKASGPGGAILVGRGGGGTLTVKDQGKLSAIGISVGRNGGLGILDTENATIELSGQQTQGTNLSGAFLTVGSSGDANPPSPGVPGAPGTGSAKFVQSTVTITNAGDLRSGVNIGGSGNRPLGDGVLELTNSQLTVNAAAGLGEVNIGRSGTGLAALDASTITNSAGSVFVGREDNSVGTLVLSNGSTINTGYFGAGVRAPYAGGAQDNGGTGIVVLNDSTINTGVFELGAAGILTGNNGTVDAVGDVIIGGTISPGQSPGRLRIKCNLIMLPGSRIVLEISGSGSSLGDYQIDQLIIDSDASFDLASAEIVFSFLGETNPNVVSDLGGLNLDFYLRTLAPSGSIDGPTQSLLEAPAASGQTWNELIDTAQVTAISESWDVTDFKVTGEGTFALTATPVPEPATWGLMFAGLAAVGGWARRRKAQAAQA